MLEILEQLRCKASRKELDDLLLPKLPEVLDADQKAHKIKNLRQAMRRGCQIENKGSRGKPEWRILSPDALSTSGEVSG